MKKKIFYFLCLGFLIHSCATQKTIQPVEKKTISTKTITIKSVIETSKEPQLYLPDIPREFRAVWIATVANINWPSKNTLSSEQQKKEALQMLDFLKNNNFNTVILQVRPSADAIYNSSFEPWSSFLTGETGKAPFPYYDPLEFWISEAHQRGLSLHVWLNPYRAYHTNAGRINQESMVRKMPEQIVKLRNGMYWFDPANPKTQDHVSGVVLDLVKRYNIDGVHFDDYFYPYKEYNYGKDFPDDKSWNIYKNSGGQLSREDWRRANVNQFVKRIYQEIKATKKEVLFGISPFGIWKDGFPNNTKGTSQYDELFADAKLWLNEGWVDYFSPQLYWKIGGDQDFTSLLDWWKSENTKNKHLWPGLNTVGVKNVPNKALEIGNQIMEMRKKLPLDMGAIHYSIAGIQNNDEMQDTLNKIYKNKALLPKSPWIQVDLLTTPNLFLSLNQEQVIANWSHPNPEKVRHWILFYKYSNDWEMEILVGKENTKSIALYKNGKKLNKVALEAVDQLGNESKYVAEIIK